MIPTDTTGMWVSADGWIKMLVLQILIGSIIAGTIFLVVGPSLLYLAARTAPAKPVDSEPYDYPPSSLRAWALIQGVAAAVLLGMNFITWYSINILGGPSGYSHHVPLEYLFLSILIEIPTIILALLTWISPHRIHLAGWLAVGALHILAAIFLFFTPWVYPTHSYASALWLFTPFDKLVEFLWSAVILGGTILLIPAFYKLEAKDIANIRKVHGLTAAILGICLIALSSYYLWWGIDFHLTRVPLLAEFPVYSDELETVRDLITIHGFTFTIGLALLILGASWYFQNDV